MRKIYSYLLLALLALPGVMSASNGDDDPKKKSDKKPKAGREKVVATAPEDEKFKPSIHVGAIVHMYANAQQKGYVFGGNPAGENAKKWDTGFDVYRARVLIGAQLMKNGNFFMETELMSSINSGQMGDAKNMRISPMILDCQYEHVFAPEFSVIGGLQLVSHNRNGLQGAAALMANDFTYFQYPYNLHPNSPLQNNLGRDLGVNFRGLVAQKKLEYRLGFFTGRTSFDKGEGSPVRVVGRLVYNVFDKDESFYYSGTNLGSGKTLSIGAGVDQQGSYLAAGGDLFLDMPITDAGSITLNSAISYISGGTDPDAEYSFHSMIPTQTTQYAELGYYFKNAKIQPWIRYEKQVLNADESQIGETASVEEFNKGSITVFGGGVNYWFNKYNTNLRLSYTSSKTETSDAYGQVWLQLQLFLF